MAKSNIINWPNQTKLTGRSSTITSAFVHSITPWITELSPEAEKEIRELYDEVENKFGVAILGADKKDNKCAYCGQPANTTDHIHPLVNGSIASGDITEIYNLLPCCASCNSSKGGESFITWYDKASTKNSVDKVGGDYVNRRKALVYLIDELDKRSSVKKILDFHKSTEGMKRLANIYKHRDEVNALMRKYEEECLRFAFDVEMSMIKIGEIAQTRIPNVLRKNKHLINDFMDATYCKEKFKVYYPIISKNEIVDAKGIKRTYVDSFKIGKNIYYLCSQWHERSRKALLDWLWVNR